MKFISQETLSRQITDNCEMGTLPVLPQQVSLCTPFIQVSHWQLPPLLWQGAIPVFFSYRPINLIWTSTGAKLSNFTETLSTHKRPDSTNKLYWKHDSFAAMAI